MTQTFEHSLKTHSKVAICHGKHCKKSKQSHQRLCAQFPDASAIRCIGVCKGPVVVVTKEHPKQALTIFKKVRSRKALKRLDHFMMWDRLNSKLKKKSLGTRKVKKLKKKLKKRMN